MKTLLTRSIALAAVAGSLCFAQVASAAAVVSYYGYQLDTPGWRSTSVTKTITTPGGDVLAPTNYYGADGYQYVAGQSLPSYISGVAFTGSSYSLAAYQPIDNPTLPIAPVVADMASSLLYQIPGAGAESSPLFAFTVGANAPASFLMGIAFGNLPLDQSPYLGASFRVAVGASTTAQVPLIGNNGLIDWLFFKVDDAANFDVINIYGVGGAAPYGWTDLAAVSFDTIPEPGTYALLGLAGFGLALHRLRRRRRTS